MGLSRYAEGQRGKAAVKPLEKTGTYPAPQGFQGVESGTRLNGSGSFIMSHAKQASKRKSRACAVPLLGAAGLSLSLATGASAATEVPADIPTQNTWVNPEITLAEEEISDVSLATFYVFDKENPGTSGPGLLLAGKRGGGGGGCRGCGGGKGCKGCGGGHGHGCKGCGGGHHGHGCKGCGGGCGGCGGGCVGIWWGGCGGCGGCSGGYWCWRNGVRIWCYY